MSLPRKLLRRAWMRWGVGISRTLYADDWPRLEAAYALEDPWDMDCALERHRFDEINRFLLKELGPVDSILEIGSGEGHHTLKLLECGKKVDGIEVSARAIARAKKRCPQARFFQARFPEMKATLGLRPRYDLAVASETLYYVSRLPEAVAAMNALGRHCLVTVFQDEIARLAPHVGCFPGLKMKDICFGAQSWRLFLWPSTRG